MSIFKQKFGFTKQLVLFFTPLFAGLTVGVSPSAAATFAYSAANVSITNFSHNPSLNPDDIVTFSDTYSGLFFQEGEATAIASAKVDFITEPDPNSSYIENNSLSQADADAEKYFVVGESFATAQGYHFLVPAGQIFSFNIESLLELIASLIPSLKTEIAYADGEISLDLYNENTGEKIDYLRIAGSLNTSANEDFIISEFSNGFTLTTNSKDISVTNTEEFASAELKGKYSRVFSEDTSLALIETKINRVMVRTPEPSSQLSLLVLGLLAVGFASKLKRTQKLPTEVNS